MNDATVMFMVTKEVILRFKKILMPNNAPEASFKLKKKQQNTSYYCENTALLFINKFGKDHYPTRLTNCHTSKKS